jgi:hypothetical protein
MMADRMAHEANLYAPPEAANYIWLILGFVLWAMVGIGLLWMVPGVVE